MTKNDKWREERLDSIIVDIGDGGTPNTNKKDNFGGSIPWVVIKDIKKSIVETRTTLTQKGYDSCSARLWPEGTVILSTGATIGEVGIAKVPLCTKQGIHGIVSKEDILNIFLYYKLLTLKGHFNANAQGSTIKEIREKFIKNVIIDFPISKTEQSKIAEILETVDQSIEQTEALIAKQERIKTGLMQDLLTKGIDENGNIRSEETHEFKNSRLGRIPVEWEISTLDNLTLHVGSGITPRGGESVYQKEGVLFIRSQNVYFCGLKLSEVAYISEEIHETMKRSQVFENDILLNITGASIGRCCYVPSLNSFANVNQHVCIIRLKESKKSDAGYLSYVIESSIGQNQILQFNAGGNREGLNYQQVRSFNIPWPSDNERSKIFMIISNANKFIKVLNKDLSKLFRIKTALMQDLLTGKKRVTPLL